MMIHPYSLVRKVWSRDENGRVNYTLKYKDGRRETYNVEKPSFLLARRSWDGLGTRDRSCAD